MIRISLWPFFGNELEKYDINEDDIERIKIAFREGGVLQGLTQNGERVFINLKAYRTLTFS